MVWSWSHSNEAYRDAKDNLARLERADLLEIYGEWHAAYVGDPDSFSEYKHLCARFQGTKLTNEQLVEFIWEKMSEQAQCTNGGHYAYCCPYGCGIHMVSFDPPAEPEEDLVTVADEHEFEIGGEG